MGSGKSKLSIFCMYVCCYFLVTSSQNVTIAQETKKQPLGMINIEDLLPSVIRQAQNKNTNTGRTTSISKSPLSISPVQLNSEYSCPLFDNKPFNDLIAAIDSLNVEMSKDLECSKQASVSNIIDNNVKLKEALSSINDTIKDSSNIAASIATDEQLKSVDNMARQAVAATDAIASIISDSSFVNSKCGESSLASGKTLLAVNNVLNGMSPFLLKLVSANPALTSAIPYIVGATALTSGISAMSEMISQKTLDMENPIHRQAVLQNTCQYMKVSEKVRYMELLHYGRIQEITENLDKSIQLYQNQFIESNEQIKSILQFKNKMEQDLQKSNFEIAQIHQQMVKIKDLMQNDNSNKFVCNVGRELAQPQNANLGAQLIEVVEPMMNLFASKEPQFEWNIVKKTFQDSFENLMSLKETQEEDINNCQKITESYLNDYDKVYRFSQRQILKLKSMLNAQLNSDPEYVRWYKKNIQYIEEQENLKRFKILVQYLSEPNSVLEKSELAERIKSLHRAIFKSRKMWVVVKIDSPVQLWLEHKMDEHAEELKNFQKRYTFLKKKAWAYSDYMHLFRSNKLNNLHGINRQNQLQKSFAESLIANQKMASFNIHNFPIGGDEHRILCQELESAWITYSRSINHLGASQFFCKMIDSKLDTGVQTKTMLSCRGKALPNNPQNKKLSDLSIIDQAKYNILKSGTKNSALTVMETLDRLACPNIY